MSKLTVFEDALDDLLAERTTGDGDRWPVVGYVVYAVTVDPQNMRDEAGEFITPEGQMSYATRGLLEQARDELTADTIGSVTYAEWEDDED